MLTLAVKEQSVSYQQDSGGGSDGKGWLVSVAEFCRSASRLDPSWLRCSVRFVLPVPLVPKDASEPHVKLINKKCDDRANVPLLPARRANQLLKELRQGWRINGRGHLQRHYLFKDFARALAFANRVGTVAEAEGHHPDLYVAWGKCKIEIWSHKANGLTESDFVLAAKFERLFTPSQTKS